VINKSIKDHLRIIVIIKINIVIKVIICTVLSHFTDYPIKQSP